MSFGAIFSRLIPAGFLRPPPVAAPKAVQLMPTAPVVPPTILGAVYVNGSSPRYFSAGSPLLLTNNRDLPGLHIANESSYQIEVSLAPADKKYLAEIKLVSGDGPFSIVGDSGFTLRLGATLVVGNQSERTMAFPIYNTGGSILNLGGRLVYIHVESTTVTSLGDDALRRNFYLQAKKMFPSDLMKPDLMLDSLTEADVPEVLRYNAKILNDCAANASFEGDFFFHKGTLRIACVLKPGALEFQKEIVQAFFNEQFIRVPLTVADKAVQVRGRGSILSPEFRGMISDLSQEYKSIVA